MRRSSEERRAARERAEQLTEERLEKLAPAIVRHPVTSSEGVLREALVEEGHWADSQGEVIRGVRRTNSLAGMRQKNGYVTQDHINAGDRYARDYELALLSGLNGRDYMKPMGSGTDGGPSVAKIKALTRLRRANRAVGRRLLPILHDVVIDNMTLKAWCDRNRGDKKTPITNQTMAMGRLVAALDRLLDHYAGDA